MATAVWDQINTPLLYALPFFVLFIGVEVVAVRHAAREDLRGYDARDARTSIGMGVGSLVFSTLLKTVSLVVYVFLWTYAAPWHVPADTWWSWVLLIVLVDLAWYVTHRFSHRVRFAWAGHQAHHSSEYFNLSTAVRQKWNPWVEGIFWLPLPLLGFTPWTIYIAFSVNLVYQFFIHTETVDKLPRPVELVMNTPSHHRVHHGSDPEYLDSNYGGIFIVWDRLFGTFVEERRRPRYGLTKPVDTYNVFRLQYGEYAAMIADVRAARGLRAKLGHVVGPPGWRPTEKPPVPQA
jgi:sterol desaturase/sphingolipid hydroxylase (fatty acid hydroxylase superfamily)